jgi:hypothetical protein
MRQVLSEAVDAPLLSMMAALQRRLARSTISSARMPDMVRAMTGLAVCAVGAAALSGVLGGSTTMGGESQWIGLACLGLGGVYAAAAFAAIRAARELDEASAYMVAVARAEQARERSFTKRLLGLAISAVYLTMTLARITAGDAPEPLGLAVIAYILNYTLVDYVEASDPPPPKGMQTQGRD